MEWVCISRDFRGVDAIDISRFDADDENSAWEYVEESIAGNMSNGYSIRRRGSLS